jgi:hypothetical protein
VCRGVGGSTGLGMRLKENRQDTDRVRGQSGDSEDRPRSVSPTVDE